MARRRKREEHDNIDRWLISYADFITLLFAFFVVMYAISSVNEGKYKTFSNSLSTALHVPTHTATTSVENNQQQLQAAIDKRNARIAEEQRKVQETMKHINESLSHMLEPLMQQGLVNINQTRRGITIDVSASLLFRTAEADLQTDKLYVLQQIAETLSKETHSIEVEGHTDDVPISTPIFPSNWELSSARASSVVRYLINHGVSAQRLVVVGLADTHPMFNNTGPENRARNRRVSITILSPNAERS